MHLIVRIQSVSDVMEECDLCGQDKPPKVYGESEIHYKGPEGAAQGTTGVVGEIISDKMATIVADAHRRLQQRARVS